MAGVEVNGIRDWGVLCDPVRFTLLLPGLFGGVMIYVAVRTIRHMR